MADARERLLEAAERILLSQGARHLSADAVVLEAGVSKGSFFYHFKTKDQLYAALMAMTVQEFEKEIAAEAARDSESIGRRQRALLRLSFQRKGRARTRLLAFTNAMLNATFETPDVATRIREERRGIFDRTCDANLPRELQLLVDLAADGLWLNEALGTLGLRPSEREKVVDLLVELTHGRLPRTARKRRRKARL